MSQVDKLLSSPNNVKAIGVHLLPIGSMASLPRAPKFAKPNKKEAEQNGTLTLRN